MKILEVVPSRVWKNKVTGLKVSPYGACPWWNESEKVNWELVVQGWTWALDNGTVGLGRKPASTYDEAVKVMEDCNARWGKAS